MKSNIEKLELIGLSVCPWTEKARWALDHHILSYQYQEHTVLLGTPALCFKMRRFRGGVTVPALIAQEDKYWRRIADSFEIARYADGIGHKKKLFPLTLGGEVAHFNDLSEAGCDDGRAIFMHRMAVDKGAQMASIPENTPHFLRHVMAAAVPLGLAYINSGFSIKARNPEQRHTSLQQTLLEIRRCLKKSAGPYLLGEFTYADIAIASMLQVIDPHKDSLLAKNQALLPCWQNKVLADEFADLLEWRDALYRDHRGT